MENTINKLFLPYGLALSLKEIGFDEHCFAWYDDKEKHRYYRASSWGRNHHIKDCEKISTPETREYEMFDYDYSAVCTAPLYDQARMWLEEKHKICIEDFRTEYGHYNAWIVNDYTKTHKGSGNFTVFSDRKLLNLESFPTRRECLNAALEKAIELIKQKT